MPLKVTLLVQDLAYGYLIAGHIIWHCHFLKFWSSSKLPLKVFGLLEISTSAKFLSLFASVGGKSQ